MKTNQRKLAAKPVIKRDPYLDLIMNRDKPIRTRTRNAQPVPECMKKPSLQQMAQDVFLENEKMNKAKKDHESARKRLLEEMKTQKAQPFTFQGVDSEGKPVTINTAVETPMVDYVDVEVLFAKIKDEATLMKCLSATKKAVVENVGGIICTEATKTTKGTENVFVKEVKE